MSQSIFPLRLSGLLLRAFIDSGNALFPLAVRRKHETKVGEVCGKWKRMDVSYL